jgi:hypothetical protein
MSQSKHAYQKPSLTNGSNIQTAANQSAKSTAAEPLQAAMACPEAVAYALTLHIMNAENRVFHAPAPENMTTAHRFYTLNLYAECLDAVRGRRQPPDALGFSGTPATPQ